MTVREINRTLLAGKPVVAVYITAGIEKYGRIIQARTRQGKTEVKCLGSGHWATLKSDETVWEAK